MRPSLEQRFWAKVDRRSNSECWPWKGAKNKKGYGRTSWRMPGEVTTTQLAHRVSWYLAHGPIPFGLTVDHECLTHACVNPTHLKLVTSSLNTLLSWHRGQRAPRTHCRNGHEFTPDNTRDSSYRPGRQCMACRRANWTRSNQARKAVPAS